MTRFKFNKPTRSRDGLLYQGVVLVDELHPRKTTVIGIVWKNMGGKWGWATMETFKSPNFDRLLQGCESTRARAAGMVQRSTE